MAWLVASAVVFGNMEVSAQPVAASQPRTPPPAEKNNPPLRPAGAAGIREAQGASDRGVLIASGLILTGIVAAMLLIEDDDENTTTTTGSH